MDRTQRIHIAALVLMALLAYGLQIPWLGFFQDDWNFVFYASVGGGERLLEYLIGDGRPGATWVYALGFGLLGYNPAFWQFFSLFLRLLTTIVFWLILSKLWPERRYGNLIASIFFLAYPFYTLQPQAVTYAMHWMSYLFYALSILLMILSAQRPGKYLWFSIPAVLFTGVHLFTIEYYVGLELLRPFLLWLLLSGRDQQPPGKTLQTVLLAWSPYLLILVFFVTWRSFVLASMAAQNDPLAAVLNLQVVLSVVRNIFADWVLMFISSWFNLIDPARFVIGPIRNLYLIASILVGAGCFYFLIRPADVREAERSPWRRIFLAGLLIFITGMISAYSIGYIVHLRTAPWNSRFVLPAMAGLALMWSGLIEAVVTSQKIRHIFLALLVGLLIGWHNQNMLNFKSAWEKQTGLYEQLIWRAPSIRPGTPILANEEILGYMGDYPTSFALNTIYEAGRLIDVPLWFFAFSGNYSSGVNRAANAEELAAQQSTTTFRGKKQDALVITYEPENNQCLWVLRPEDAEYRDLPERIKEAALSSNVESIQPQETDQRLFHTIVNENKDGWCYFYQKADLARQMGDWDEVLKLWREAQSRGYHPGNGFEYIAFIEAHAHAREWEESFLLTRTANRATKGMYLILCPVWERLTLDTPASEEKQAFVNKANEFLECAP